MLGYDRLFKVVFIGDTQAGKTSLGNRCFKKVTFDQHEPATIGVDFITKNVCQGEQIYKLQCWDTAGQERFRSIVISYIRSTALVVICISTTLADGKIKTEDKINEEILRFKTIAISEGAKVSEILLVGTKADLLTSDTDKEAARILFDKLATENGFGGSLLTSAKKDIGLTEDMEGICELERNILKITLKTTPELSADSKSVNSKKTGKTGKTGKSSKYSKLTQQLAFNAPEIDVTSPEAGLRRLLTQLESHHYSLKGGRGKNLEMESGGAQQKRCPEGIVRAHKLIKAYLDDTSADKDYTQLQGDLVKLLKPRATGRSLFRSADTKDIYQQILKQLGPIAEDTARKTNGIWLRFRK